MGKFFIKKYVCLVLCSVLVGVIFCSTTAFAFTPYLPNVNVGAKLPTSNIPYASGLNVDDTFTTITRYFRKESPFRFYSFIMQGLSNLAAERLSATIDNGEPKKGIDVSSYQGDIDWELVKNEVDFVILRCGYGQDIPGQDDEKFVYNADECTRLNIPFGVYLYSYADSVEKAKGEAEHTIRLISDYELSYPVFYDIEDKITLNVPPETIGEMAKAFCDVVKENGYEVGIYSSLFWWQNYLTDPVFDNEGWVKWIAQYYDRCTYTKEYSGWQYTDQGQVAGIEGNVDMNLWYSPKPIVKPIKPPLKKPIIF